MSLTKEHPSREVKFQMARPGELSGRVVDFETGKPVAGLHVWANRATYSGRQRSAWPTENDATTGDDGRFVIHGLTPGGGDMSVMAPVPVGSGAQVSVGEIVARKAPLYRIHGSFAAGGCAPGDKIELIRVTQVSGARGNYYLGSVPCGKDFLLVGREPDTYWLNASVSTSGHRVFGFVPVTITDKNVEAAIVLGPGVAIDARFVMAEGSRQPDFKPIRLMMSPVGGANTGAGPPEAPDANGQLRLTGLPLCDYGVTLFGLPEGFYFKEIRYNGSALPGKTVPLNGEAMAHNLEILLDDKPAAVSDGDRKAARAAVVMIKCPLSDAAYREPFGAATDDEGRFRIGGLAPGTYRVFAVAREMIGDIENFTVLDRVLKGAKEVTLDINGFQDVTLELADTRR